MAIQSSKEDDLKIHYGLLGVTVESSSITKIDGLKGNLCHRGYSIETLAEQPFERVAQMLLEGDWPSDDKSARVFRPP